MKKVLMMTAVLTLIVFGAGCNHETTGAGAVSARSTSSTKLMDTAISTSTLVTKSFSITGFS